MDRRRQEVAQEAARIICDELVTDWRDAKTKAAQRLGLPPKSAMPDNREVQQAVIDYQRLFGGADYAATLARMRAAAVKAMKLLAGFEPRLVGGTVSGAVTQAHRVQLHAFADKPELLDIFLSDRGIPFEPGDRDYRYQDGATERVPLVSFEIGGVGVDVAVFGERELRRPPVNTAEGVAYRRLGLAEAEALASPPG